MNPLEHHTFRELLSSRVAVCNSTEAIFELRSYHYTYMNYLQGGERTKWWHYISVSNCSTFLTEVSKENGLFSINGIPVCISCLTSEYVKSRKDVNGGDPTCSRCSTLYKGWGES